MQDDEIFELYKPLKNSLRQTEVYDTLRVLWAYTQNLQFDKAIPSDIQVFEQSHQSRRISMPEWELETLMREAIINCQENLASFRTLKMWNYFSNTINKLRDLENGIAAKYVNKDTIFNEFFRLAHRQFHWQSPPNKRDIIRYFKIFNYPTISNIVENNVGLTTEQLYLMGFLVWGHFIDNFSLTFPIQILDVPEVSSQDLGKFINCFSEDFSNIKKICLENQEMNEKFVYALFPLRFYPLIKTNYLGKDSLICPSPSLFVWRLTGGLYYDICRKKNFDNEFGKSFQKYVGEVLKVGGAGNIGVIPEEEFLDGKNRKDTVDWIAEDKESAIFIECKAKRITLMTKTELEVANGLEKDLDILAEAVMQLYKNIRYYGENKYPSYKLNSKKIFPLVVTLEDWHLFGKILEILNQRVEKGLKDLNLPLQLLIDYPYAICSVRDLEIMVQIMATTGIKDFMDKKLNSEKREWEFKPFMLEVYKDEITNVKLLFEDDFFSIFPERINLRQNIKRENS